MTTDMFLAIFLVGPLAWLCLRGEIRTWLDTRRQAERDRNARIVRELRRTDPRQPPTLPSRRQVTPTPLRPLISIARRPRIRLALTQMSRPQPASPSPAGDTFRMTRRIGVLL